MLLLARSGLGYLDCAMLRATSLGAGCRSCAGSHGWGLGLWLLWVLWVQVFLAAGAIECCW